VAYLADVARDPLLPAPIAASGEPVWIVEPDPAWPARFEAERVRLTAALADVRHAIEHCGSTSVPGLVAKPIIDVLLGLHDWTDRARAIQAIVGTGYEHRGEAGIPDREYFRRGVPRAFQVHMVAWGSEFWRRHVLFRDRLRADPALAQAYAELKRDLAERFRNDRIAYTDAKGPFIHRALGLEPPGPATEPS
jgi:GrpB-like predicted nucleotidyltransferase (UPF0157 family)